MVFEAIARASRAPVIKALLMYLEIIGGIRPWDVIKIGIVGIWDLSRPYRLMAL